MASKLAAARFDPATADSDLWRRFHELRHVQMKESRPDDPLRPDEIEELQMKRENPFQHEHRYEISEGGTMVSWFYGETVKPGTAEYEPNKHLFWADVYVHPDHRRRGIGGSWLPLLLELVDLHACSKIGFGTEVDPGRAFLKWVGAQAKLNEAENRLRLADVDWAMVERWAAEGPLRSPETQLAIYDGFTPEEMWDDYAPQLSALLNTMPFDDLDIGQIVVTPDHMRDYRERMKLGGERLHQVIAREPAGVVSGITDIIWAPYRPTILQQQFTGVRPEARGRGLGKWIKAAMLLHLRKLYPEAQWMATGNAGSNAPMLAINKQLGFKQYRVGTEYQMSRDALAARVKRLSARS
ncbi:MAG: GNAT family N-acetyltransferase [Candidatus Dormibacter sp.]